MPASISRAPEKAVPEWRLCEFNSARRPEPTGQRPRLHRTAYRHDSIEPRYARRAMSRRAPNYDRKLTRRIVLDDGTRIMTLRDAANLFAERFATVTNWRLLEIAIERLIAAAESAERDTIKAATDAIQCVLRAQRIRERRGRL